ncbi:alpha/beta hydrolase family protein [Salinibacillus xinjiangensis]|uniref:alpha/beta hydrolase family protein n=1 Tax=Salinibacillus xinjiangensis TaxID=1229268 RepID=UPI001891926D|nr:alpha/beta hydrolase [Salinibacillus xinjiangensis]
MVYEKSSPNTTIQKTLVTARLFEGFWDRWIAHGIKKSVTNLVNHEVKKVYDWVRFFNQFADHHFQQATRYEKHHQTQLAEEHFQLAGLYFNLIYWIFPDRFDEKVTWYKKSLEAFSKADENSRIKRILKTLKIDGKDCVGRVRVPSHPKGSIVIINPMDSSKEELYTYENHFVDLGFATFSFDGPGQGETFTINGLKANRNRWNQFMNKVITLAYETLPQIPVYLFGTSSGASWSIEASQHPYVRKAVAVSPPISNQNSVALPNYFQERMSYILEQDPQMLPETNDLSNCKPVLLVHGNQDVMVKDSDIYELYNRLPSGKKLIEYHHETHCCNGKLTEIREQSVRWFND